MVLLLAATINVQVQLSVAQEEIPYSILPLAEIIQLLPALLALKVPRDLVPHRGADARPTASTRHGESTGRRHACMGET